MLLGCIADDLTGATDLSLMLAREGMRTVQTAGIPPVDIDLDGIDALVIALKSRSIPAQEAVSMSLEAARCLRALGARPERDEFRLRVRCRSKWQYDLWRRWR